MRLLLACQGYVVLAGFVLTGMLLIMHLTTLQHTSFAIPANTNTWLTDTSFSPSRGDAPEHRAVRSTPVIQVSPPIVDSSSAGAPATEDEGWTAIVVEDGAVAISNRVRPLKARVVDEAKQDQALLDQRRNTTPQSEGDRQAP